MADRRPARSGDNVWAEIKHICRNAQRDGRTIATLGRGVPNRIIAVEPDAIIRASDEAHTPDGAGSRVTKSMVTGVWDRLATERPTSKSGRLYFTYALLSKIRGISVLGPASLTITDWDTAMEPFALLDDLDAPIGAGGSGTGSDQAGTRQAWQPDELEVVVREYFVMLQSENSHTPYSKIAHNRRIQQATGRSHASVEFKLGNASAVLRDLGMPNIPGTCHGATIRLRS